MPKKAVVFAIVALLAPGLALAATPGANPDPTAGTTQAQPAAAKADMGKKKHHVKHKHHGKKKEGADAAPAETPAQ